MESKRQHFERFKATDGKQKGNEPEVKSNILKVRASAIHSCFQSVAFRYQKQRFESL